MVDGITTAHCEVSYIYCLWVHSDHIRAPVHKPRVPSPLQFVYGIPDQSWEFQNLLIHRWVSLIWYFCTYCRHGFLSNNVPVVIRGGKMALPDNAGCVKDGMCEDFAIDQQWIVGWKLLVTQYRTSLGGQDETASAPYSQVWHTSHCSWVSSECKWLY